MTIDTEIRSATRYLGAKNRLAPWIISWMPRHDVYCELFGGSAAILLRKPRSPRELYNDIFSDVYHYFLVLRDRREELVEAVRLTPYSRDEYERSMDPCYDPVEAARRFLVRSFMCISSEGAFRTDSGFRWGGLGRVPAVSWDWKLFPERLNLISERLQGVLFENEDYRVLMDKWDCEDTLFYLDPPYLLKTRTKTGRYAHEFTEDDHVELLELALAAKGKVMISGYESDLYMDALKGWRIERAGERTTMNRNRIECLWMNYEQEAKQAEFDLEEGEDD